ncbi:glutathione S-transferase A-like isoform X1 [Hippocampus comes]|uniref:Glutathione S-transferase rho n=1 Tax=Hippocampus comes TaxID=109280 RepID=A0A3Q2XG49_HIPCM|nr:PREDICTED: glutathione S-transferase A-like isoform X1 [Hippocampus comes]
MAKDMTLYWGAGSPPCWRVMIALEEKDLRGYNSHQLSFEKMEHKSKRVLDINPRGQLPTFHDGQLVINESCAVCIYLESNFKKQGNELIPTCPNEQALMYQRVFEAVPLGQKLGDVIYYEWKFPEGERHESAKERNKNAVALELSLWERYLKQTGPFLAGKTFSLADVVVFPNIAYAFYYGLCPERFPKLAQYYNLLKERPSIKKTWPPNWEVKKDLLKELPKTS